MWAMNRRRRKGEGMRARSLPARASLRQRRVGQPERCKRGPPAKPSLTVCGGIRGGGHERIGNPWLCVRLIDFGLKTWAARSR
jgi:hypothetical protein